VIPPWAIGRPGRAQDAVTVAPVTAPHGAEHGMDLTTVGGGAGTLGGIVGIVLLLERFGLLRIPRRDSDRATPPAEAAASGHVPPCSPLQALQTQVARLEARQEERADATAREIAQLRDDAAREAERQRNWTDRLGDKLDAIADRIPKS
jgi:hypothetical protein